MYGPPGNGKTHAIKTLINRLGKPVVYVRTFARRKSLDTDNIEGAFRRARELAPCLLILEDLDTLVRRDSLAFFLNELDGLRSNHGILTLATTNHLEKLDPALTQRPSRFDRKIAVGSPNRESRQKFLTARLGVDVVDEAALDDTDGFSIAFLTELITTVRLAQMKEPSRSLSEILTEVIGELRSQVTSVAPAEDGDDD
jgi:SpoVK/Ycf46/Vps4 family AAA+-type ATPase